MPVWCGAGTWLVSSSVLAHRAISSRGRAETTPHRLASCRHPVRSPPHRHDTRGRKRSRERGCASSIFSTCKV
ncbi:uncharacterized protein LY79DRAFT_548950 [Colletotrichum navitas]|uniref:Uncharacterized protein n=1 Tax=Colletotrichum navitas TaxID=681940 RepID=A0AAD8Q276_9PEZI|nr:uncharacterized protein LY79DRAFT_548950 [Colletotrichum navitas]KAK1594532.1 hypothetical protein LY79DRAFT_548950 [Colletotrichum navitas]